MLKKLILKDFGLVVHPTTVIYFILAAFMMFIPNYPRFIGFFYILISVFVMFVTDLQYKDREFCGLLPVSKKQVVQARVLTVVILETAVVLISIPCAVLGRLVCAGIQAVDGLMEANMTVFASALLGYGIANIIIIRGGYRKRFQVKLRSVVAMFVFMAVCGVCEFAAELTGLEFLASGSADALVKQIPVLAIGVAMYALLTWLACRLAVKEYEKAEI